MNTTAWGTVHGVHRNEGQPLVLCPSQPDLIPGLVFSWPWLRPSPWGSGRRRLGRPDVSGSPTPPETADHDCKGPPGRAGPRTRAPVLSRLSGHSGRLWRAAGPTNPRAEQWRSRATHSRLNGPGLSHRLPSRSGAPAGIEPAVIADVNVTLGSARPGHSCPHTCTRESGALRAGSAAVRNRD